MCFSNIPESGSVTHSSMHLRHGHLISVLLFCNMSFVAHCIHLATQHLADHDRLRAQREQHNYISRYTSPKKFGMTFPNNAWEHAESAPEICRNGNESTFRQNIGNSFSRHQYNTRFTYIKPQQSFTYTSNHKHHIYIKPQDSHIHQTTSFTYTYTSNHKLHIHIYIKPQDFPS